MVNFEGIFCEGFRKNNPASFEEINFLKNCVRFQLPFDFEIFLCWSNGGEGKVGELYLSLWSIHEIIDNNKVYSVWECLGEEVLGIGTDGGDYCFIIDVRSGDKKISAVPLGALEEEEIKILSDGFVSFVENISSSNITGNDL